MLTDGIDRMGGGCAATLPERKDAGKTIYPAGGFRAGGPGGGVMVSTGEEGRGLPLFSQSGITVAEVAAAEKMRAAVSLTSCGLSA